jgi:hypothetical protein
MRQRGFLTEYQDMQDGLCDWVKNDAKKSGLANSLIPSKTGGMTTCQRRFENTLSFGEAGGKPPATLEGTEKHGAMQMAAGFGEPLNSHINLPANLFAFHTFGLFISSILEHQ